MVAKEAERRQEHHEERVRAQRRGVHEIGVEEGRPHFALQAQD